MDPRLLPALSLLHAAANDASAAIARAVLFVILWIILAGVFLWVFVLSVFKFGSRVQHPDALAVNEPALVGNGASLPYSDTSSDISPRLVQWSKSQSPV